MSKILVTDSLFIFDEHVQQLKVAGYEVERLDKPKASEDELVNAVKGKVGYILGGIEKVTERVIEAADELKVIAFTGADYEAFIPGWQTAKQKGIAITNTPGANAAAVSEFALATALAMQRNLFELSRTGSKAFETTRTLKDATIGVVGVGRIGEEIIKSVKVFGPEKVVYYSRTQKECGAELVSFDKLIQMSDVIFVAVPESAGQIFNAEAINKLKNNTLIVSISPRAVIDFDTLLVRLQQGTVRAAIDWPAPSGEYRTLPLHIWFNTNDHTAYNTTQANKVASDMAVKTILNILKTGEDERRVV